MNEISCYSEAETRLNGSDHKTLAPNTFLTRMTPESIGVIFHETCIVHYHDDGWIKLNTGGWRTPTTKNRMNRYSPFHVTQKQGQWHVNYPGYVDTLYHDGMTLRLGSRHETHTS